MATPRPSAPRPPLQRTAVAVPPAYMPRQTSAALAAAAQNQFTALAANNVRLSAVVERLEVYFSGGISLSPSDLFHLVFALASYRFAILYRIGISSSARYGTSILSGMPKCTAWSSTTSLRLPPRTNEEKSSPYHLRRGGGNILAKEGCDGLRLSRESSVESPGSPPSASSSLVDTARLQVAAVEIDRYRSISGGNRAETTPIDSIAR
ncbi:hypothetical protein BHM03_00000259 [Ensete ventricosum]|nr:hypothetical protein BHM03_00000259 [Ensete ventricosum]